MYTYNNRNRFTQKNCYGLRFLVVLYAYYTLIYRLDTFFRCFWEYVSFRLVWFFVSRELPFNVWGNCFSSVVPSQKWRYYFFRISKSSSAFIENETVLRHILSTFSAFNVLIDFVSRVLPKHLIDNNISFFQFSFEYPRKMKCACLIS